MEEKTLLFIALIGSLMGLCGLFLLYSYTDAFSVVFAPAQVNQDVLLSGKVMSLELRGSATIVYVEYTSILPVVFFDEVSFRKGDEIFVQGSIQNGEKGVELLAQKLSYEGE